MDFEKFELTFEMLRLVGEIDEFKGAWKLLSRIRAERLTALKQVATIESIGSSTRIEGAKLSDAQIEALLSGLKNQPFRSRDEQEVAGYSEVMESIFENWMHMPFSENQIKQLHRDLLKYSIKDDRHRGHYKSSQNNVEAFGSDGERLGTVFETASPFDTPFKMTELVSWIAAALENREIHPLLVTGIFIVRLLAIHPFQDGNGRLSRTLTTLMLLKSGYSYVPFSSLESIVEANKDAYYLALRKTQATLDSDVTNWKPWLEFFFNCMHKQVVRLQVKIDRENIIDLEMPPLAVSILELIKNHGRLKMADLEKLTGDKRSTIKLRLTELVGQGLLKRNGRGPATFYTQPR